MRTLPRAACPSLSLSFHYLMSGFNYVEKSFFVTDHCLTFTNASSPPHHRPLSSVCCLMEEMAHICGLSTFPPLVWNAFESRWKEGRWTAGKILYATNCSSSHSFTGVVWWSTKLFLKAHDGYVQKIIPYYCSSISFLHSAQYANILYAMNTLMTYCICPNAQYSTYCISYCIPQCLNSLSQPVNF